MKKINVLYKYILTVCLMGMTGGSAVAADQLSQPKEVVLGLNDVYVPRGFTSKVDAYVIVNGIFPNGCYRWKGAEIKNVNEFNHEIKTKALVNQGMCIMVLMPFTKEVHLGQLASGEHKLKFLNGDGTYIEKTMKIH